MSILLLVLTFLVALAAAAGVFLIWRQLGTASGVQVLTGFAARCDALDRSLSQKLATSQADMAGRLEQVKGDLRQQVSDRLESGFSAMRISVEEHLASGRREQSDTETTYDFHRPVPSLGT